MIEIMCRDCATVTVSTAATNLDLTAAKIVEMDEPFSEVVELEEAEDLT